MTVLQSSPLPGPSSSIESTVQMRHNSHLLPTASDLNPPKRCHSWNGLANLASASPSPTATNTNILSPKVRKVGEGQNRPRSLNLSMSNLSVPPAVLELNAKVDKDLIRQKGVPIYRGSADNILEISEGSEGTLSNSNSGASLSLQEVTDFAPKQQRIVFEEIDTPLDLDQHAILTKDGSSSQPSLSPATPTVRSKAGEDNKPELTMSQPLLKTFQNSLEQLKTCLTSAHTAPSHLSKGVTAEGLSQEIRRRSHSLGNLVSCTDVVHSALCMKCGRTDKRNLCLGATSPSVSEYAARPRSIHDSLEMIEVT